MTIKQEVQKSTVASPYIELFIIDGSAFGAPVFRFTSSSDYAISFGTFGSFTPFPIKGEGWQATAEQPPRPKLTISNVTKVVQPYLQQYGDMKRAKVTRIRTLAKFLDSGSSPDDSQHLPLEVYYIEQKTLHDKQQIQFTLTSAFDLPNVKLPAAQCLKDNIPGSNNVYAPGLSTARFRG